MPQFVIQRSLSDPGPGATDGPLAAAPNGARRSVAAPVVEAGQALMRELGPQIRWLKSYVTERKIYCLYDAPSEDLLRAHARARGFPAEIIERVWAVSSTNAGAA